MAKKDNRPSDRQMVEQIGKLRNVTVPSDMWLWVHGAIAALQWCRWAGVGYVTPAEMFKAAKDMRAAGKRVARKARR